MLEGTQGSQSYIDIESLNAAGILNDRLYELLHPRLLHGYESLAFVCIGTDRSTGDSLGPLIGYKLKGLKYGNVRIYGSLENPVHAKNLSEVIQMLGRDCIKPCVVAIDACLGRMDRVGFISVGEGSIKPGAGVHKDLAPIGDIFVTGIVNFGGFMDFLVLQNTRLCTVMKMADAIAAGVRHTLWRLHGESLVVKEGAVLEMGRGVSDF